MSATLPIPPSIQNPPRRSRRGALLLAAYVGLVIAAFASGRGWLDEIAALMVVSLVLWPGLRRLSPAAIILWFASAAGIATLAVAGQGDLALDFLPVIVNAACSTLFARTLGDGEPLIARLIAVVESPERVALPRVASYARALTWVWAIVLGAQAVLLMALIACAVPDGLLTRFGITPPIAITAGTGWRWYLNFGSYATVLACLVVEYAFRRWYLRHIPHVSLPVFISRLVQRWPMLARSVMHETAGRTRA